MTRPIKTLLLILALISIISLSAFAAFGVETESGVATDAIVETDPITQPEIPTETEPATQPDSSTETEGTVETEPSTEAPGAQLSTLYIIVNSNCKTQYKEGELFDPTNFLGYVTGLDSSYSSVIESSKLSYLETEPLTTDVTEITFTYENLTYKVPITVTACPVVSMEVTAAKTEFLALDVVDFSNFTVVLTREDGRTFTVDASDCEFYPALGEPISAYTKSFTVTYTSGAASFTDVVDVSVSPILVVTFEGIEHAYLYEGTTPEKPHGLTATVHYNAMQTISKTVTDYDVEYLYDTIRTDANGKTRITLVFDSKKVEVEVTVAPIVNYKATGFKSVYYYGDTFSYANAKITAYYGDGMTRDVTSEVEFVAPTVIDHDSMVIAVHNGYNLSPHLGFTLPKGKLSIVTQPNKLNYEIGELFDPTGLTVAIEYNDGVRLVLTPSQYTLSATSALTANDSTVKVQYYGLSENISIKVGNQVYITGISLIGQPDVMSYYEGYLLNTSGVVVEAYYSNGTTAKLNISDLTFTPSLSTPLTVDVKEVKISIDDGTGKYREVSYPITVKDKEPIALVHTSLPNKLVYAEGEKFDPTGLELRLYFNDNTYVVPSTYNFSPELGTTIILHSNSTEKHIIHAYYEYEGKTYNYPIEITVTPAEIENLFVTRYPAKMEYEVGEQFDPTGLDIIVVYKDRTLAMQSLPDGYYTYSPTVITETTTEIVFSFRGLQVTLPITVTGIESTDETTEPVTPPETTEPITPPETTQPPEVTTDVTTEVPDVTTVPETEATTSPEETTSEPEVTTIPETTTSPDAETSDSGVDTEDIGGDDKEPVPLLYIWIAIIGIIVLALIALIIYYKKNFT